MKTFLTTLLLLAAFSSFSHTTTALSPTPPEIIFGPEDWTFGTTSLPTDLTAHPGYKIRFSWEGTHNVFLHPSGTCDQSGAYEVDTYLDAEQGTATYIVQASDLGRVLTFACDIGTHCVEGGMIVRIAVVPVPPPPGYVDDEDYYDIDDPSTGVGGGGGGPYYPPYYYGGGYPPYYYGGRYPPHYYGGGYPPYYYGGGPYYGGGGAYYGGGGGGFYGPGFGLGYYGGTCL